MSPNASKHSTKKQEKKQYHHRLFIVLLSQPLLNMNLLIYREYIFIYPYYIMHHIEEQYIDAQGIHILKNKNIYKSKMSM